MPQTGKLYLFIKEMKNKQTKVNSHSFDPVNQIIPRKEMRRGPKQQATDTQSADYLCQ